MLNRPNSAKKNFIKVKKGTILSKTGQKSNNYMDAKDSTVSYSQEALVAKRKCENLEKDVRINANELGKESKTTDDSVLNYVKTCNESSLYLASQKQYQASNEIMNQCSKLLGSGLVKNYPHLKFQAFNVLADTANKMGNVRMSKQHLLKALEYALQYEGYAEPGSNTSLSQTYFNLAGANICLGNDNQALQFAESAILTTQKTLQYIMHNIQNPQVSEQEKEHFGQLYHQQIQQLYLSFSTKAKICERLKQWDEALFNLNEGKLIIENEYNSSHPMYLEFCNQINGIKLKQKYSKKTKTAAQKGLNQDEDQESISINITRNSKNANNAKSSAYMNTPSTKPRSKDRSYNGIKLEEIGGNYHHQRSTQSIQTSEYGQKRPNSRTAKQAKKNNLFIKEMDMMKPQRQQNRMYQSIKTDKSPQVRKIDQKSGRIGGNSPSYLERSFTQSTFSQSMQGRSDNKHTTVCHGSISNMKSLKRNRRIVITSEKRRKRSTSQKHDHLGSSHRSTSQDKEIFHIKHQIEEMRSEHTNQVTSQLEDIKMLQKQQQELIEAITQQNKLAQESKMENDKVLLEILKNRELNNNNQQNSSMTGFNQLPPPNFFMPLPPNMFVPGMNGMPGFPGPFMPPQMGQNSFQGGQVVPPSNANLTQSNQDKSPTKLGQTAFDWSNFQPHQTNTEILQDGSKTINDRIEEKSSKQTLEKQDEESKHVQSHIDNQESEEEEDEDDYQPSKSQIKDEHMEESSVDDHQSSEQEEHVESEHSKESYEYNILNSLNLDNQRSNIKLQTKKMRLTPGEAARRIQRAFKARQARRHLKQARKSKKTVERFFQTLLNYEDQETLEIYKVLLKVQLQYKTVRHFDRGIVSEPYAIEFIFYKLEDKMVLRKLSMKLNKMGYDVDSENFDVETFKEKVTDLLRIIRFTVKPWVDINSIFRVQNFSKWEFTRQNELTKKGSLLQNEDDTLQTISQDSQYSHDSEHEYEEEIKARQVATEEQHSDHEILSNPEPQEDITNGDFVFETQDLFTFQAVQNEDQVITREPAYSQKQLMVDRRIQAPEYRRVSGTWITTKEQHNKYIINRIKQEYNELRYIEKPEQEEPIRMSDYIWVIVKLQSFFRMKLAKREFKIQQLRQQRKLDKMQAIFSCYTTSQDKKEYLFKIFGQDPEGTTIDSDFDMLKFQSFRIFVKQMNITPPRSFQHIIFQLPCDPEDLDEQVKNFTDIKHSQTTGKIVDVVFKQMVPYLDTEEKQELLEQAKLNSDQKIDFFLKHGFAIAQNQFKLMPNQIRIEILRNDIQYVVIAQLSEVHSQLQEQSFQDVIIFVLNKKDLNDYYDLTVHNQLNHVERNDIGQYLKNNLNVVINIETQKINYVSLTNILGIQKQNEQTEQAGQKKQDIKYESLCDIMVMHKMIEYEMRLEQVMERIGEAIQRDGQMIDGVLHKTYSMKSEMKYQFQHLRVVVTQATLGKKRKILRLANGTEDIIKPELYETFLQQQIEIVADDNGNFEKLIQHKSLDGWWLSGKDYFKYLMKKHGCKNMDELQTKFAVRIQRLWKVYLAVKKYKRIMKLNPIISQQKIKYSEGRIVNVTIKKRISQNLAKANQKGKFSIKILIQQLHNKAQSKLFKIYFGDVRIPIEYIVHVIDILLLIEWDENNNISGVSLNKDLMSQIQLILLSYLKQKNGQDNTSTKKKIQEKCGYTDEQQDQITQLIMGNYYKKLEIDYKKAQSEKSGKSGKDSLPTRTDLDTSKSFSNNQNLLSPAQSSFTGGMLTIDVVSADLKRDTEIFSKMDPYAVVELQGVRFQTKFINNAGKKVTWDQQFQFPILEGASFLHVSVLDQDPCSQDDLVGKVKIPLANICKLEQSKPAEKDFDLIYTNDKDKTVAAGTVKLRTLFKSEAQLQQENKELLRDKMHRLVTIQVRVRHFLKKLRAAREKAVEERERKSKEERERKAKEKLDKLKKGMQNRYELKQKQIEEEKKRQMEDFLKRPRVDESEIVGGILKIYVQQADLTHDTETFGKMDPFVKIDINGETQQTDFVQDAGKHVQWNQQLKFDIKSKPAEFIKVKVIDKDPLRDDSIGECQLQFRDICLKDNKDFKIEQQLTYKNKPAGIITLTTNFTTNTQVQAELAKQEQLRRDQERKEREEREAREQREREKARLAEIERLEKLRKQEEERQKKEAQAQENMLYIQRVIKVQSVVRRRLALSRLKIQYLKDQKALKEQYSGSKLQYSLKRPEQRRGGQLQLTIQEGHLDRKTDLFGKMEPYIRLMYNGTTQTTRVDQNGDQNPKWNETFTFNVIDIHQTITMKVLEKDVVSDDKVGEVDIKLSDLCKVSHQTIQQPFYYKQQEAGLIIIKTHFQSDSDVQVSAFNLPDNQQPQEKSVELPKQILSGDNVSNNQYSQHEASDKKSTSRQQKKDKIDPNRELFLIIKIQTRMRMFLARKQVEIERKMAKKRRLELEKNEVLCHKGIMKLGPFITTFKLKSDAQKKNFKIDITDRKNHLTIVHNYKVHEDTYQEDVDPGKDLVDEIVEILLAVFDDLNQEYANDESFRSASQEQQMFTINEFIMENI